MTTASDRPANQHAPELDIAIYPAAEAGRLTGLSATRVRRWLQGYEYRYAPPHGEESVRQQRPVVRRRGTVGTTYASFLDLIDLLFVKQFLDHGTSLQKVRKALDEATEVLGTDHFARETFFTDGSKIYLQMKASGDAILELLSGGQWVIASIIQQLAERIEFHKPTGLARRWYPMGRDGLVVLDPLVSFGRPTIVGRGIATAIVYDFYLGENRNPRSVHSWMGLNRKEARAAIEFEESLAA